MTTPVINRSALIRVQRNFPEEPQALKGTLDKMYVDVATAVNFREIGLYPTNRPSLTGQNWYLNNNQTYQGLRQIYSFTSFANITHNINTANATFTNCTGSYTDGTNWYGIQFGTSVVVPGQVLFYIDNMFIYFVEDGTQPAITSGQIVIEWISPTE